MLFKRKKDKHKTGMFEKYVAEKPFKKALIGIVTLFISFLILQSGASPTKYDIQAGEVSPYDITANRDIENRSLMEKLAQEAADSVSPVLERDNNVPIEVVNDVDKFFASVMNARESGMLSEQTDNQDGDGSKYKEAVNTVLDAAKKAGIPLSSELAGYMLTEADDSMIKSFKNTLRNLLGKKMAADITEDNLSDAVANITNSLKEEGLPSELEDAGTLIISGLVRPNSIIDRELTRLKREEAYNRVLEKSIIVKKGTRILNVGDVVTEDKHFLLRELDMLDNGGFDYAFAAGLFALLLMLEIITALYMKKFCKKVYNKINELIVLSLIVIITLAAARVLFGYSILLVPVFMAPMLIAILLDIKLAIVINFLMLTAVTLMTGGDPAFIMMGAIGGAVSPFVVSRANQRSMLSAAGLFIGAVNAVVIVCMGLINKGSAKSIASDSLLAAVNGVVSIIVTIGLLPFMESAFKIITPLKLLELANPNQPLIKRLLMEAPGTYHHSLMVGNMAEVAADNVGGNSLLARVGAYYHDIGKTKRPGFFRENQITENPHDRMKPNLSTLVITSHTGDGASIAAENKIPAAIQDIIRQHHGTTLVAYFYHKAQKEAGQEELNEEDFRYPGPKPTSREAAIVMLADSVEAAVRSMQEKTVGRIEGLVRKIIRDKLEDGQLDQCELTLKDLDEIARAFMQVFSGFFHAREKYPEIKPGKKVTETLTSMDQIELMSGRSK